ncbi:MAG TPA: hypothetical protein VKE40_19810 [Gemmataceae bacterium]|nr:hypothetical protein [Gemmataceae bacterium]
MQYEIACECGRGVLVTAGQAGSTLSCGCGRTIMVPSLRELKERALARPEPVSANRSTTDRVAIWIMVSIVFVGLLLLGILSLRSFGDMAAFGYLLVLVSHFWLLLVMIKQSGFKAVLLALFIPFFSWAFAVIRWDASKWPVVLYVVGWVIFIGCLAWST